MHRGDPGDYDPNASSSGLPVHEDHIASETSAVLTDPHPHGDLALVLCSTKSNGP